MSKYIKKSKNNESKDCLDIVNAYPNDNQYASIPGTHDTSKWLEAVREIYYKEKNGSDRVNAVRQVTSGWNLMETFDFLNWFKFYEEGAHLKYKTASLWYENGAPGYFLHVNPNQEFEKSQKEQAAKVTGNDIDDAREFASNQMSSSEKKNIIEKQRSKIIARLDSAEKLLRTENGQMFAGKELETLMEAIYALKKKVQLVNKLSVSTRLYEDMIIREANILSKNGFYKAGNLLHSVAQAVPTPASPAPPTEVSGSPGGLPSMGPGMPQNPPESAPNNNLDEKEFSKGIQDFLNRVETNNISDKDDLEVEDNLSIDDSDDDLVIKEAQIAAPKLDAIDEPMTSSPPPAAKNPTEPFTPVDEEVKEITDSAPPNDEQLEVTEKDLPPVGEDMAEISTNFDSKLDELMSNVTVVDIISELDSLSKIFKTREIPRRLSRADMMLDSLGLAAFFPSLSEAQNKSLEANNYIATRVDDILSKLRGSLSSKEIDLQGEDVVENPEVSGIKNKLKSDDDKEKVRKQMRKEQDNISLDTKKETPEIEINEDLAAPAAVTPLPKKQI